MKKNINRKLYDTDTAEVIYEDRVNQRTIYKTPKGAYFMVYKNGAFQVMTEDEVMDYLYEHDPDKYVEIFGEIELA